MQLLTDPSGYVNPAVYPQGHAYEPWGSTFLTGSTAPVQGHTYQPAAPTAEGVAGSIDIRSHSPIPVPTAAPPRGFNLIGGIRFPFRIGINDLGINAFRSGMI